MLRRTPKNHSSSARRRGEVVAIGTAFADRLGTTESGCGTVSEGRITVGHAVSDALRLQPTETIDTTVQVSMRETVSRI